MSDSGGAPSPWDDCPPPTIAERVIGVAAFVVGLVFIAVAIVLEELAKLLDRGRGDADREPPWFMKDPDW